MKESILIFQCFYTKGTFYDRWWSWSQVRTCFASTYDCLFIVWKGTVDKWRSWSHCIKGDCFKKFFNFICCISVNYGKITTSSGDTHIKKSTTPIEILQKSKENHGEKKIFVNIDGCNFFGMADSFCRSKIIEIIETKGWKQLSAHIHATLVHVGVNMCMCAW